MPLTPKGEEIKKNFTKQYGAEKGEQYFYAAKNSGRIKGVDAMDPAPVPEREPEVVGNIPTEEGGYHPDVPSENIMVPSVVAQREANTVVESRDGSSIPVGNQNLKEWNDANRKFWSGKI